MVEIISALQIIFLFFFTKKIICERHLSRSSGLPDKWVNQVVRFLAAGPKLSHKKHGDLDVR